MDGKLLHCQFASEAMRRRELETIGVVDRFDAESLNHVLRVGIFSMQSQAPDASELEGDNGLASVKEAAHPIHFRAGSPGVNPKHGHPTAIEVEGQDFGVVKRRPSTEPGDDGIRAEDCRGHSGGILPRWWSQFQSWMTDPHSARNALGELVPKSIALQDVEAARDASGATFVPKPGTETELEADLVLLALGFIGSERSKLLYRSWR
jgi:hypothetical protein